MSDACPLIPAPSKITVFDGVFRFNTQTALLHDPSLQTVGDWLRETIGKPLGIQLPPAAGDDRNVVSLRLTNDLPIAGDEAYTLRIQPRRIRIAARSARGLVWAIQSLRQLLPVDAYASAPTCSDWTLPCCAIDDAPVFAWRGLMLDCARHFMPIEFIYRWIDLLSLHKLNVFHWHLTDDQGWRIEIKQYPRLTKVGAWRKQTLVGHALPKRNYDTFDGEPHGGFYTQAQIRNVVAYAAVRGVTVVPEIELPGHAQAAIAAYPELGNIHVPLEVWTVWGINPNIVNIEDATVQFFKNVLDEVIQLFPSRFIHIGGDEALKDQWRTSEAAQQKIRDLGLQNEDQLQSWFIRQIDAHLTARGRRLVGWDEIIDGGLAPGATVMSWRGESGGIAAALAGHDVVMSPCQTLYFDHYASPDRSGEPLAIGGCSTLEDVYRYRPVPDGLNAAARSHVLGAQANLWTEYVPTPAHAERMVFPRACALAEVLWQGETDDFKQFQLRLATHLQRLRRLDVQYHPSAR